MINQDAGMQAQKMFSQTDASNIGGVIQSVTVFVQTMNLVNTFLEKILDDTQSTEEFLSGKGPEGLSALMEDVLQMTEAKILQSDVAVIAQIARLEENIKILHTLVENKTTATTTAINDTIDNKFVEIEKRIEENANTTFYKIAGLFTVVGAIFAFIVYIITNIVMHPAVHEAIKQAPEVIK